MLKQIY